MKDQGVLHSYPTRSGKKLRRRKTADARKGKISEVEIIEEWLDAYERVGPAELERSSCETSRGP
jgi:hypothetical protein